MSGLDPEKDALMEISIIITDGSLKVIAEKSPVVLQVDDDILSGMSSQYQKLHQNSDLLESCRESGVSRETADVMLLEFVRSHTPKGTEN